MVSIASRLVSSCPVAIEREAVDDDVAQPHPPVAGQVVDQPGGHGELPLGGPGLALLVDGERDHRGAVLADQRHHPGDS